MASSKRTTKRLGLSARAAARRWFARAKQMITTEPKDATSHAGDEVAAQEVARAAAELGGGAAKIAQLLGYRAAPTTDDARAALAGMWDDAPPMSAADARGVIADDLGKQPGELFDDWSDEPFAAASIGQVHRAGEYAVKVQYPFIADALRDDLASDALVKKLAGTGVAQGLDDDAVAAIRRAVLNELDYRAEADALARFGAAFAGDDEIVIPALSAEHSAGRVLTMQHVAGRRLRDVAADPAQGLRNRVGRIIFRYAWSAPLVHGLVQADPNPGNYLVTDDPVRVAFLDYGCTAELDTETVDLERQLWRALLYHDRIEAADRFRKTLLELGLVPNPRAFHSELCREWEHLVIAPFERTKFLWTEQYASDLTTYTQGMLRSGKLRLPAPLVLLWRQRLGVASVLGMLRPTATFRDLLSAMVD